MQNVEHSIESLAHRMARDYRLDSRVRRPRHRMTDEQLCRALAALFHSKGVEGLEAHEACKLLHASESASNSQRAWHRWWMKAALSIQKKRGGAVRIRPDRLATLREVCGVSDGTGLTSDEERLG